MADDADLLLEQQYSRMISRQHAQAETAKLITTFSTAIAATIVASALQVLRGTTLTTWSSWLLAACFLVAVVVILADRTAEPNLDPAVIKHFASHDDFRQYVETKLIEAEHFNNSVLKWIRALVGLQLILAGASGAFAATSLLAGSG